MGKMTGFMELERVAETMLPIPERVAQLARVHRDADRRRSIDAGRTLHGLRHPVLPERLSDQQHHPRLERPRLPPPMACGARRASLHQ
jgi:hypothetical protein